MKNEALSSWVKWKVKESLTHNKSLEDSLIRPLSLLLLSPSSAQCLACFVFINRCISPFMWQPFGVVWEGWSHRKLSRFNHIEKSVHHHDTELQLSCCVAVSLNLRTCHLQNAMEFSCLTYNLPGPIKTLHKASLHMTHKFFHNVSSDSFHFCVSCNLHKPRF